MFGGTGMYTIYSALFVDLTLPGYELCGRYTGVYIGVPLRRGLDQRSDQERPDKRFRRRAEVLAKGTFEKFFKDVR